MHFWINKAAGRNYDFVGRRYPVSPLPKNRPGHIRGSRGVRSMVTPAHCFQNLTNVAGPSFQSSANNNNNSNIINNNNNNNNRGLHRAVSLRNSTCNESRNCPSGNVSLPLLRPDNVPNNVNNVGSSRHTLSSPANVTNRRLLDFSEFSDAELAGYRLRCSVWIMFVLMTGFVTAAKFYFDHEGTGLEVLVFCGLLVTLMLSGCFYTILCRRSSPNRWNQAQRLPEGHHAPSAIVCSTSFTSSDNMRDMMIPVVRQNPPPPPYHIAILIPPINSPEEVPPPSYDKIIMQ